MKAEELMLDDWVRCLDSTHKKHVIAQIDAIEEGRGESCILVKEDNTNWFTRMEHFTPIPIAPVMLEENGFVQEPSGYCWYQEQGIKHQNYCLVQFRKNGQVRRVEMDFVNKVRAEFRDIHFVHQLQHELRRVGKEIKL